LDKILLNDKNEYPEDAVLARCLGKAKASWDEFVARAASVPGLAFMGWRFYNDGKAWLDRLVFKKKTVCWVAVADGLFRIVFYFTTNNDAGVKALDVDGKLKDDYFAHEPIGKLKPFVIRVKTKKSLDDVFTVIAYKISI
jgi:hypothetical protein